MLGIRQHAKSVITTNKQPLHQHRASYPIVNVSNARTLLLPFQLLRGMVDSSLTGAQLPLMQSFAASSVVSPLQNAC